MPETVPAQYFVDLYRQAADPWQFETSQYERDKYAATLKALPRERYENALELACSIGVFTRELASRCDKLTAVDVSDDALQAALSRCHDLPHVHFARCVLPGEYPRGWFDLVTACEVGTYFSERDVERLVRRVTASTVAGATIVLVHWTPPVDGHATTVAQVHGAFIAHPQLAHVSGFDAPTYRLDILQRRS